MSASAIGIMDGAFFVGRKEILDWINSTLEINLNRIEDTASGAVACQLLDIMHPGAVPMHKVNWAANKDFEFVANYKILQSSFSKLGIDKFVDVDRLISARYMDNLEFMQWFKRYFEMHCSDRGDYDVVAQRSKGKGGSTFFPRTGAKPASAPKSSLPTKPVTRPPAATKPSTNSTTTANTMEKKVSTTTSSSAATTKTTAPGVAKSKPVMSTSSSASTVTTNLNNNNFESLKMEIEQLKESNETLQRSLTEVRGDMEGLEKERDFYFDKLRDIEVMLQDLEDNGKGNEVTSSIFKILYATADGFEVSNEDIQTQENQEDGGQGQEMQQTATEEFESF